MPAAAVIPAPIAYIKVVAVKKLVVGFWDLCRCGQPNGCVLIGASFRPGCGRLLLTEWAFLLRAVYFEKIRVFKAGGNCLEYISMG